METWQIVAITVAALAFIGAIGWLLYTRNRSRQLQEHFGPEYDRRVNEIGDRHRAESELTQREARVNGLRGRPLSVPDHERFVGEWRTCQARFVDNPADAVHRADKLISEIMHARGYPINDPNDRLADLCAAYPARAEEFREANGVLIKNRRGEASTEELRRTFVRYRSIFDEMLGGQDEELKRVS